MNPMLGYNPLMGMVMDGGPGNINSGGNVGQQVTMTENKVFPPAISVQRLNAQQLRQLRETQEMIKDSCQGLVYGSPGPPQQPQQKQLYGQPGVNTSTASSGGGGGGGPPPPPQRTSTLRKNVNAGPSAVADSSSANNTSTFETHPQDYS